jgi:HEAT repeat protein
MLRPHLADGDAVMRLVTAEALVRLGESRGLGVIRSMASGEGRIDPWQQVSAILALGRTGLGSDDVERLRWIESRQATEGAVRVAAFGARGMLGDYSQMATLAEIAAGRRGFDDQSRALALQMLARSAYGPAWQDVCRALGDGDALVRLSAAWAMLAFSTPRAESVLAAVRAPDRPQMLTEREVLRPVAPRLPESPQPEGRGPLDYRPN